MILFELLGWIDVLLAICGLVICIRFAPLSNRMYWLVLAFGISAGAGAANRVTAILVKARLFPQDVTTIVYSFSALCQIVASALLVFGLYGIFQEVRERFHFVREAYENQRGQGPPVTESNRESLLEPTDPAP